VIGTWDNSKCIYAALPACLKLGRAPADFGYPSANYAGAGYYPIYNGPQAATTLVGKMFRDVYYTDGKIDTSYVGAVREGGCRASYELPFSTTVEWTIDIWMQCELPIFNPLFYSVAVSSYYNSIPAQNGLFAFVPSDYHLECYIKDADGKYGGLASYRPGYTHSLDLVHITFVKKSDGYFDNYIDGIKGEVYLEFNVPYLGATVNGGWLQIHSWNGNIFHQAIYNEALTAEEILALHVLGPDLGGLYGYDLGGGVMRLRTAPSSNPIVESIITSSSPPVLPRIVSTSPLIGRKQDKDIYLAEEKKVYDRYKANYYRDFKSRLV